MKSKETLSKEIQIEYDWYNAEHRHLPNVAYVKIKWFDEDEPEDNIQTIVMDKTDYNESKAENGEPDVVPFVNDEEVLYYVSGIDELILLVEENNSSDFTIVEFIGFERLKND